MANKANQHYVPQFYFRYFSEDGKSICLLNRRDGKVIVTAPIKGQASKKYYYGDESIENSLSEMEGNFSKALRELKETNSFERITYESYLVLLQNITVQKSRTATERNKCKGMYDWLYRNFVESEINSSDTLDMETKEVFSAWAKDLEADPQQYQSMGISTAFEYAECLADLLPVILHNKTNRPFIFSDSPVIFTNPLLKQITSRGVLGATTPGLIVLYPLSSKHCVMLIDEAAYSLKKSRSSVFSLRNLSDIALINKLQIHSASSAIYFSDSKYSKYIQDLWRQEKKRLADHVGKRVEIPEIDDQGEKVSDLFHFFEKQLPLVPNFSFLSYREILEGEYRFSRRKAHA